MDGYRAYAPSCLYTHILALVAVLVTPYLTYCALGLVASVLRRAKHRRQWVRRTRS